MMTVTRLLLLRIVSDWRYQYQVARTAVDWIVAIYVIIPFSYIFIDFYLSLWREVPGWLFSIPLNALIGLILVFIWSGTVRIFLEDADQIFLLQRKIWTNRIIMYSLGYSMGSNLLSSCFFLIILAPLLLLRFGFSTAEIIWLTFLIVEFKTCIGIVKQLVKLRFKGWTQYIIWIVLFLITIVYLREGVALLLNQWDLFYVLELSLLIALILLLTLRMNLQGAFLEDIFREKNVKLRLAKVMLQSLGTYVKKPRFARKRPLLFRNSNLIFKKRNSVNVLVEICIKAVLRNAGDVGFYLQMVGVYVGIIVVFPGYFKWLLWIVLSIVLTYVVKISWLGVINAPFVCFFPWLPETKIVAARKAIFLMALPGQLLLGFVVVQQSHSWVGGLMLVPLTVVAGFFIAKRISRY